MQRRIPYAVANYEEIVEGRYHFVDKTRFIRELENYKVPVMLRPRRFEKSLWCSILECNYDVNRKKSERLGILSLTAPLPEDTDQVERYTADLQRAHPEFTIARHVACLKVRIRSVTNVSIIIQTSTGGRRPPGGG